MICYSGATGTSGVGVCKSGNQTCKADGSGFDACAGEVVPAHESCTNTVDDNCNGQLNEACHYTQDVKPILVAKCSPCHAGGGSGGHNAASMYSETQLSSYFCPGKTKGACTIARIESGAMPFERNCTGNPVTDSGNALCTSADQQAILHKWIDGGQLE
jgi:hypothetical protein